MPTWVKPMRAYVARATVLKLLTYRLAVRPLPTTAAASAAVPAVPSPRPRQPRPGGLSRREIEVLRLVADGRTTGEIATQLFISARTAEHHIQNIYTKIGVSSRVAATRWALQQQVVDEVVTR